MVHLAQHMQFVPGQDFNLHFLRDFFLQDPDLDFLISVSSTSLTLLLAFSFDGLSCPIRRMTRTVSKKTSSASGYDFAVVSLKGHPSSLASCSPSVTLDVQC